MACGILVPQPGMEPAPPAVEVQSLNHWTTREVPDFIVFKCISYMTEGKMQKASIYTCERETILDFFLRQLCLRPEL